MFKQEFLHMLEYGILSTTSKQHSNQMHLADNPQLRQPLTQVLVQA